MPFTNHLDALVHLWQSRRPPALRLAFHIEQEIVPESKKEEKVKLSLEEEMAERVARGRKIALVAAEAGMEMKALAVEIIDVTGQVDYADFLVIMTGTSDRHCAAIADHVDQTVSKSGTHPLSSEGKHEWVLIDFFDVVVHVFSETARDAYDLSGLWMDAGRVPVPLRQSGG